MAFEIVTEACGFQKNFDIARLAVAYDADFISHVAQALKYFPDISVQLCSYMTQIFIFISLTGMNDFHRLIQFILRK